MSDGKVIEFPQRPAPPEAGSSYDKPILFREENGLYSIIWQGVAVHYGLDVEGQRELIRKAALWDSKNGPPAPTGSVKP